MDSLADRLKGLGFKPASSVKTTEKPSRVSLESAIQGVVNENSAGSFVIKEQLFPFEHKHGDVVFSRSISTGSISKTARIEPASNSLERMLFIDTETSGLSGGAGTFAFLIGVGRFVSDGFQLQQFIIRDPTEELAMLLHLSNVINENTIFVTFNGKSFDIPLIQYRFILNRFPDRIRELPHLDILHLSRRLWRRQLNSCTLKDLENAILHFSRTSEDVPGWMIPDIYFEYLRTGDPKQVADVIYHNAQDIVSLAALFIHISELLQADLTTRDYSSDDLIAIGRIYWEMHDYETAVTILQACRNKKLNNTQKITVNFLLGQYQKYCQDYVKAAEHWEIAANSGDLAACIELAMYHEHKKRDLTSALYWSEIGLSYIEAHAYDQNAGRYKEDLSKRIFRLKKKASKNVQETD